MTKISDNDPDRAKGATEGEEHNHDGNLALSEPLGHRDQDPLIKGADTDFPEPGNSPEHSNEGVKTKTFAKKVNRKK
jgi:hypothetical protein